MVSSLVRSGSSEAKGRAVKSPPRQLWKTSLFHALSGRIPNFLFFTRLHPIYITFYQRI